MQRAALWRGTRAGAAALARILYPPACAACGAAVEGEGLCGPCWRDAAFLWGVAGCDRCGAPLPGQAPGDAHCDDCLRVARPWSRGRAALLYRGTGRRLALALKHGDRTDLARPLGAWMARAAGPLLLDPGAALVPVPLHWARLMRRRYNQAELLARAVGRATGRPVLPDALLRARATPALGREGPEARAALLAGAVVPHPRRGRALQGRVVVLVDDVMTTGATLAATAEAALAAGAQEVHALVLARAARGDG